MNVTTHLKVALHILKVITVVGGAGGGRRGVGEVCGFVWKDKKVSQGRFASHDGSREEKREVKREREGKREGGKEGERRLSCYSAFTVYNYITKQCKMYSIYTTADNYITIILTSIKVTTALN